LGAFISSVKHQERLVGTREVGTPRRVVASKKFVGTQKKDFVVEPRVEWEGGALFCMQSLQSQRQTGWWVEKVYKNVSTKQNMCVSPPAIFYSNLLPKP